MLEVLEQERVQDLAVDEVTRRARGRARVVVRHVAEAIVDLQVALDERQARRAREREQPGEERVDAHGGHHKQPEPDEDEDLLVEQVDGQCALNRVLVVVLAQGANGKVAHGHARETWRFPKVLVLNQITNDL